ncbi:hypothetical protein [Thiorhodococcus minor]|uniref:hypothetical protein n=1 Tax=Thiorhodococcus minor TaxID=57489 RepID=UPI0014317B9C|nr:hypothetical protein [Thiorhodococcus minor]
MAKPNYAFEKRQRDLAKKAKKEEKRQRKISSRENPEEKDRAEPTAPTPEADTRTSS